MKRILNYVTFLLFNLLNFNALANELKIYEEVKTGKAVLLDIREKDEIKEGMIKGATWLPLSSLNSNPSETIDKLKGITKNKDLYIYCRSGRRVETFLGQVQGKGIKGVNLGGFSDLVSKGLPSEIPKL